MADARPASLVRPRKRAASRCSCRREARRSAYANMTQKNTSGATSHK